MSDGLAYLRSGQGCCEECDGLCHNAFEDSKYVIATLTGTMQLISGMPPGSTTYHVLMPLPSKDICLNVTKSKMQLIILICMCLHKWCEHLYKMEESL